MDKKQTNKQTELHQFRKEPSLSSLNSIGQTIFKLESGNGNFEGQTDKQTDRITQFRKEPSCDDDLCPCQV